MHHCLTEGQRSNIPSHKHSSMCWGWGTFGVAHSPSPRASARPLSHCSSASDRFIKLSILAFLHRIVVGRKHVIPIYIVAFCIAGYTLAYNLVGSGCMICWRGLLIRDLLAPSRPRPFSANRLQRVGILRYRLRVFALMSRESIYQTVAYKHSLISPC